MNKKKITITQRNLVIKFKTDNLTWPKECRL